MSLLFVWFCITHPFRDVRRLEPQIGNWRCANCDMMWRQLCSASSPAAEKTESHQPPLAFGEAIFQLGPRLAESQPFDAAVLTFFVSNCDIIINEDYSQILKYHKENKNELTVVAALKNYPIVYGVLYTKENGLLDSIVEKPDLTFKINTGLYILEPNLLDEIPEGQFYHITS